LRSIGTILKKLWPEKIRYQMILGIALVLFLLMSLFVFEVVRRQQSFLKEQNQAQAIGLGETFAVNADPYLLANDIDALQKLVQSHIDFPNLKYAMILSSDGTVLAHTDNKYLGTKPNDSISLALKPQPQTQILLKNNYILDVAVPVLGNNKEIIGWARIGLGQEYIYNNLRALARNGLLYIIIAILIGSFFAFVLASRLVKGLYQLIFAADKIKKGDRDIRVSDFRSYEISKLGLAFNEMLDELRDDQKLISTVVENLPVGVWILNAKGEIIFGNTAGKKIWGGSKFVGIDEFGTYKGWFLGSGKLIEPHEWGGARAITKGETVLNDEVEIEAFDKSHKIILHSSLPLLDVNQKINGAIVINVDITENKKAEAEILHEKNISDTIIRGLPGIFYIADIDARFLRWNKNFETVSGYSPSEIANMRTIDFIEAERREAIFGIRPELVEKGQADAEVPFVSKDGKIRIFLFTVLAIQYNDEPCFLGIGTDITEKKKAEAELRKINHNIGERVKELRCLYRMSELSNDPAKTMDAILQDCADVIPPSYQYPEITCARIIFGGQKYESPNFKETVWKQEANINTADSNIGRVEVYYTEQMPDEQEGPFLKEERFLINSIADILGSSAERRKGEQEILRLNRLYQFISQINELVLKLEDRDAIFSEACRIAIEYGKFRMAWIGFYNEKEERVVPFTWAGHEEGYLEAARITGASGKVTGKGPTGRAVRSKTYQYCNDIANDPIMLPWREDTLKRNYRSSISLPVIVNSELVALFTLYMSEPFFFNESEIKLLLEVTDNIAYALDKIRLAELHKKAELELTESEEKFRSLVEQSLVGVYILQDDRFLYVNPGFEKTIGYSKEELLYKLTFEDLIHEEDLEKVRKNYSLRIGGENPTHQYTFRAISRDGTVLYLEVIASTIIYNGKPAIIGTLVDITGRIEEEKRIGKAVNDAQERERMQIGMELHDNVKQILAASMMSLDFVKTNLKDKKLATDTLDNLKGYIKEAIDELRRLSHQLAPSVGSSSSLLEKVETLVNNMNIAGQLHVSVYCDEFEQSINEDIQLALYRIVQEQFSNILKYAKASSVFVSIKKEDQNIVMTLKDDGKGFDTSGKKEGIGLENIRRRAQVLDGQVKIISSPGNGCEVIVQIPVS